MSFSVDFCNIICCFVILFYCCACSSVCSTIFPDCQSILVSAEVNVNFKFAVCCDCHFCCVRNSCFVSIIAEACCFIFCSIDCDRCVCCHKCNLRITCAFSFLNISRQSISTLCVCKVKVNLISRVSSCCPLSKEFNNITIFCCQVFNFFFIVIFNNSVSCLSPSSKVITCLRKVYCCQFFCNIINHWKICHIS